MKIRVGDIVIVNTGKLDESLPAIVQKVHSNVVIDAFVFGCEPSVAKELNHYMTVPSGYNWTWSERDPE